MTNSLIESDYFTPEECINFREEGVVQGRTPYLWHNDKSDGWALYKRNSSDISNFGDEAGYSRWVSAYRKDSSVIACRYCDCESHFEMPHEVICSRCHKILRKDADET